MKKKLTEAEVNKLQSFIANNKKIQAIKFIRNITGLGLKDAKDIIDNYFNKPDSIINFEYELKNIETEDLTSPTIQKQQETYHKKLSPSDIDKLNIFLKNRQKINAIKLVKEKLGTSLKNTKKIVEDYIYNPSSINFYKENATVNKIDNTQHQNNVNQENTIIKLNIDNINVLKAFLSSNQKLSAIKYIKEEFNTNLKDAKNFVDNYKFQKKKAIFEKQNNSKETDPIFKKEDEEIITFEKMKERDKKRKKKHSNSGCMLTLSIFIIIGIIITGTILYL